MLRIHVRLDFENEAGKLLVAWLDEFTGGRTALRRRRVVQKSLEDQLDAKIIHRTAKEHRGRAAGENLVAIKLRTGDVEHLKFLRDLGQGFPRHALFHEVVRDVADLDRCHVRAAGRALKQMHLLGQAIEHALEIRAVADRPVHRERLELKHTLDFVQQLDRALRRPVAFVDKRKDRHAALAANLKQLLRLRLDALRGVEHHHHRVHGG